MASGIWHLACQTYALNLIDSHSGQKQAPQLFSSPKSFRIAKSTPSSAKLLAKLSPISKWLSKPPLLFKSPLLSKSALFFAPLLLLSYTQGAQALSAQTSRVIEGSAPYLTFDGGRTKATDTDTFLAIELPDGRRITPSTNTSSSTNPIMVSTGITFNDIHTVLPSGTTTTSLNSLITQGQWGDDDGDGQGAGGVTASGNISLTIQDKDGRTVNRGDTLSKCSAPYRVTLSSTGGSLTTQYGVPNRSTFSGGGATYYIKPDSSGNCYFVERVMPNLRLNRRGSGRGQRGEWSSGEGFSSAFPTTGADGLYFDLKIPTVLDASQLSWTVNTSGTLNATVSWRLPNQSDYWITDKSRYVTRVTLSGPRADSTQRNSSNPSPLTRPSLPQTFELVGRDRSGNEVRYVFRLSKWFVGRGKDSSWRNQRSWCNSLGYRLPRVRELSNTTLGDFQGGTPPRGDLYYTRNIGFFFSEWGIVSGYVNTNFGGGSYMTAEADRQGPYVIRESDGELWIFANIDANAVCVTP
ncbi:MULTISPECIES: hypothetical protein [unclassified Gilliamella]|uniref:hypothetical protein n=1 Tax=unclassified Gilliamella TaxID=2685620 RepID=UPI00132AD3DD|nr:MULTISPECIES: hypothetical protein [unclassified Gilliamella]MWN30915.1 hypothetical protein [Gilliamella sp. Pra-s60]MWP28520.1 hypothetical protein [Gilliamella sp. Pra-s54]